jgi:carbon starvation protein CstA
MEGEMKSDSKLPQIVILVFVVFGFLFLAMSVPRLLPPSPDFLGTNASVIPAASATELGMRDIFTRIASSLFFVMVASVIAVYLGKSSPAPSPEEFDPDRTLPIFETPYQTSPLLARINVVDIE